MTVERVVLRRVDLEFVTPFRTSFGTQHVRQAVIVEVQADGLSGWGEVVCGVDPLYSEEYVAGALDVLERYLAPAVVGAGLASVDVAKATSHIKGQPMAKAGLEMAVLDAQLRASGRSLRDHLGGVRDRVAVGVSVGIADSHAELLERVAQRLDEGYGRIKLKVEPGWDLDMLAEVRTAVGDDVDLQVDANGAYAREDHAHLLGFDRFDLVLLEQPHAKDDLGGHARLAADLATPLCLDESITSVVVAVDAIELGAVDIVNIKAGRVGGLLEAVAIHDACRGRDVPVWCGGMLETGIGRAANLALASLPGFTLPGDLSSSTRYFHRDLTAPFVAVDGWMDVPTGPGLGIDVDHEYLDARTRVRVEVSR